MKITTRLTSGDLVHNAEIHLTLLDQVNMSIEAFVWRVKTISRLTFRDGMQYAGE